MPMSVRAAAVILAGCAIVLMLEYAQSVLVPITLSILLAMVLSPIVSRLHRLRIPRTVGAAIAVLMSFSVLLVLVDRLVNPAAEWLARIPQAINRARWVFRSMIGTLQDMQETTQRVADLSGDGGEAEKVVVQGPSLAELVATNTGEALITLALMLVLLYFMLLNGNLLFRKTVHLLPTMRLKRLAVSIWNALRQEVSRYLLTITGINIGLGLCTAGAMYLLGLPNPLLWGALAAVFNFIPYLGPIFSASAILLASLLTFAEPGAVLLPPAVFLCLNALEGNFITPAIVGRRLALNPIAVFLFLMIWGWVWGIAGMLIAVPLLVSIKIVSERVHALYIVRELLSPHPPQIRRRFRLPARTTGKPPQAAADEAARGAAEEREQAAARPSEAAPY